MIEQLYMIRDNNANIYLKPILISRNDVAPLREVTDIVENPETLIHKHAGDFDLVQVGDIDLENGQVEGCAPRLIARCIDLLDKKE